MALQIDMQFAQVNLDSWSIPIMNAQVCQSCGEVVSPKYSVGVFTDQANFENLAARLTVLLQISISADEFACRLCRGRLKNLEEKLTAKRSKVRAMYQRAGYVIGVAWRSLAQVHVPPNQSSTLKRPKDMSGGAGVSPATAKAQAPSSHTLFSQGTTYLKTCIQKIQIH